MPVTRRKRSADKTADEDDKSVVAKALTAAAGYDKESFPELMSVVYWVRQVVALVIGIVWGIIPLLGLNGLIAFATVNAGILFVYYGKFLGVDQDSFGQWELMKEGFMPSTGVFVLAWILTYTALHHPGDLN